MMSCDIPKGVVVLNRFSRVTSAKFEIFFHSKKHSIPLRNTHLKLIAADSNTIQLQKKKLKYIRFFDIFLILKLFYIFLCVINTICNTFSYLLLILFVL